MNAPMNIAVLVSGNGSNLQAIIDHQKENSDLYKIALVICNRPGAYGIERAQNAGIETAIIDHTKYKDRLSFDTAMQQQLDSKKIELVVLAGFMRILTEDFTQHFLGKMLNIHPSLLPKYTGLNTHQRALDAGDRVHGISIHFVTPELDGGPVILQAEVDIEDGDTAESLAQKVHAEEHIAYPTVVKWFAERRLQLLDGKVSFDQNFLQNPVILQEIQTS